MNGGDAGADGAFTDFELAAAGDERGVSDFYAADVGDGVVGAGVAVEGDAEVAGSGLGLGGGESARAEKSARRGRKRERVIASMRSSFSYGARIKHGFRSRQFKA